MRIDAGLIIGIALEFVIMLYFANSTLQPKKNYYMSSAICFIGYLIIFGVSIFNMFIFNIISFTIIDFLIFILGYRINYKTALFQTFMMTTVDAYNDRGKVNIFFGCIRDEKGA